MALKPKFKLEDLDIPEKLELREYQKDIVKQIDEKIANGEHSIMVQLSPGGGKTLIMGTLVERYSQKYNVLSLVHRQEIIKQTMKRYAAQGSNMNNVDVAMIQTAVRHTDKIDKPKLIIVDEAHHTMANSYLKVLDKFNDPNIFKIYFTATPWRADGKGFTSLIPEKNLIIGPSTKWLIDHGYLSDFDYYQPKLMNEDMLKFSKKSGDYTAQSIKKASKTINPEDIVRYYKALGNNHQGIVYASTVEQSKEIVETFKDHGISAFHLDGASDKNERDEVIEQYRQGKIKILSNVEIFTEGLDLPNAYVALIARPTMSLSLYLQFAMRVLRPQDGKKAIIFDFVGNAEKLGLPSSDFQWTLRSHEVKKTYNPGLMTCHKCKKVFHKKELLISFGKDENGEKVLNQICPLCNEVIYQQAVGMEGGNNQGISGDEIIENENVYKIENRKEFEKYWLAQQELNTAKSLLFNFKILEAHRANLLDDGQTAAQNVDWNEMLKNIITFFYNNIYNIDFSSNEYQEEINKLVNYINENYKANLSIKDVQDLSIKLKYQSKFNNLLLTNIQTQNSLKLNIQVAAAQIYSYSDNFNNYYQTLFDSLLADNSSEFLKLKNELDQFNYPPLIEQNKHDINDYTNIEEYICNLDVYDLLSNNKAYSYYMNKYNEAITKVQQNNVCQLTGVKSIRYRTGTRGIEIIFRRRNGYITKYLLFTSKYDRTLTKFSAKDVCNLLEGKKYSEELYEQIKHSTDLEMIKNKISQHIGESFFVVTQPNDDRKILRMADINLNI